MATITILECDRCHERVDELHRLGSYDNRAKTWKPLRKPNGDKFEICTACLELLPLLQQVTDRTEPPSEDPDLVSWVGHQK